MAMPVLVVVLVACLWVLSAVGAQGRCASAARLGARAAARGDSTASVLADVRRLAPPAASVSVSVSGSDVRVRVSLRVAPLGSAGRFLPPVAVGAEATAEREQPPAAEAP